MLSKKLKCSYMKIIFAVYISSVMECYSLPCTFNTMCMCWIQDDQAFTKMDISCMGIPFARFPGTYLTISVAKIKIILFK